MTATAVDFSPQPDAFTSGGVLWRRNGAGTVDVILVRDGGGYVIPRGPIQEDERVADAAVRRVYERTGICGSTPHRIGRAVFTTGEVAWFHVMHVPRRYAHLEPSDAEWVPLRTATTLVATAAERQALEGVLVHLAQLDELLEAAAYTP